MKRFLPPLLLGLALGFGISWVAYLRTTSPGGPAATEEVEPRAATNAAHGVQLDRETQARMGLVMEAVRETNVIVGIKGQGRVLDVAPLVQQLSDLDLARVAAEMSRKDWERLKTLFSQGQNASARALEGGEAAMKRDSAQLAVAESRLLVKWGGALVHRTNLTELSEQLARADISLLRLELPMGVKLDGAPIRATVSPLQSSTPPVPVNLLGPAPDTDPLTQGKAFLALFPTNGLSPGATLDAFFAGPVAERTGIIAPSSAIVRHEGEAFVFVAKDNGSFVRVPVALSESLTGGWLVTSGLTAGDQIVVVGAQTLFSRELNSSEGAE